MRIGIFFASLRSKRCDCFFLHVRVMTCIFFSLIVIHASWSFPFCHICMCNGLFLSFCSCFFQLVLWIFIAFIPENNVQKRCFVCSHTVKREKNGAIQSFIAQIVIFHCEIPIKGYKKRTQDPSGSTPSPS